MDYERLKEERRALDVYLAKERALMMAQNDWHGGLITEEQVVPKARQYEAYLRSRPVALETYGCG